MQKKYVFHYSNKNGQFILRNVQIWCIIYITFSASVYVFCSSSLVCSSFPSPTMCCYRTHFFIIHAHTHARTHTYKTYITFYSFRFPALHSPSLLQTVLFFCSRLHTHECIHIHTCIHGFFFFSLALKMMHIDVRVVCYVYNFFLRSYFFMTTTKNVRRERERVREEEEKKRIRCAQTHMT